MVIYGQQNLAAMHGMGWGGGGGRADASTL